MRYSLVTKLICPCLDRAPEAAGIQQGVKAGQAADVWSLAATMLHMLSGRPPYPDLNNWQALSAIIGVQCRPPEIPKTLGLPALLHNLLSKCFSFLASDRPSTPDVIKVCSITRCKHVLAPVSLRLYRCACVVADTQQA